MSEIREVWSIPLIPRVGLDLCGHYYPRPDSLAQHRSPCLRTNAIAAKPLSRKSHSGMDELFHECGIAAVYHLTSASPSPLVPDKDPGQASRLIPGMLLDMQNRGQLAAGFTTFNPQRLQLIDTHKNVGGVSEVFRMDHRQQYVDLMEEYAGEAAIGHVPLCHVRQRRSQLCATVRTPPYRSVQVVQFCLQRSVGELRGTS